MLRGLLSVGVVAFLAACQSAPPVDPEQGRAAMLKDLGLDPSAVVYQDHARYAIGSGSVPTAFRSGLYVQTQTDLYLFRHKEDGKALEQDVSFPLAKLQYATLESWMFTHLKQLELGSPSGLIAVSFHDQADGMAGDADKTESAYAALMNAGVRGGKPAGQVWPVDSVKPYTEVYPVSLEPKPSDHADHAKPADKPKSSPGH